VIRELQPDAQMVLDQMAALNLPPLESMSVEEARAFHALSRAALPPGPEVAAIEDGVLPGAAGDLAYRLYRPDGRGPHPIVVYFHGGGFVIGDATTDGSLCRDLCARNAAIVISVDYRHAPEHRFPAAMDDGLAAVRWIADHAAALVATRAGWPCAGGVREPPSPPWYANWSATSADRTSAVRCCLPRPPIGRRRFARRERRGLRPHHGTGALVR
jgi:hypothetical protein